MAVTTSGSFEPCADIRGSTLPLLLWKTTVTVPTGATSVSVASSNKASGMAVAVWIDPTTLTASATIKGYSQGDGRTTKSYWMDYTVPDPAVETSSGLNARTLVFGKQQIDVASATAGDSFVIYVYVMASADNPTIDTSGISLTASTEYDEGDTDATITGGAILWEDAANTLRVPSATYPLPVVQTGALPAGTNAIGKLAANTGVDIGDVDVTSVVPGVAATSLGKAEDDAHNSGDTGVAVLAVRDDVPAANAGSDGDYECLHVGEKGGLWTQGIPATPYKNIDVDETEDAVSANPCVVTGFYVYNNAAAATKRFLKFYNATTGDTTVGTTTPVLTFELDGTQGLVWNQPILFSAACTIAATTAVADNDTGAPSANDVVFTCGYYDL